MFPNRNTINRRFQEEIKSRYDSLSQQPEIEICLNQFESVLKKEQGAMEASKTEVRRPVQRGLSPFWKGILYASGMAILIWVSEILELS